MIAAIVCDRLKPGIFYHFDHSLNNFLLSLAFIPHHASYEHTPTLSQGWTLEYEMFFYFTCVVCLLLPRRRKILALTAVLIGLILLGIYFAPTQKILATYTSPLLLEFAAGLLLSDVWQSGRLPRLQAPGYFLICLGIAIFAAEEMQIVPVMDLRVIDWGIPAFMMVAGALILENSTSIPIWRLGLILGNASYALYLSHGFVVAPFLWRYSAASPLTRIVVCASTAITLAIIIHRCVERPLHDRLLKISPK